MAFSFVQGPVAVQGDDATSVNVSFASLPAIGSLVVVTAAVFGTPTLSVSDNQGHTYTEIAQLNNVPNTKRLAVWYVVVTASSGIFTVTVTISATDDFSVGINEYSVAAGQTPTLELSDTAAATSGGGGGIIGPTLTPAGNALYLGGMTVRVTTSLTADNGYTTRQQITSEAICNISVVDKITSGAQNPHWVVSVDGPYVVIAAAFKEVAGGTSLTPTVGAEALVGVAGMMGLGLPTRSAIRGT